jgi:hypothetical protein
MKKLLDNEQSLEETQLGFDPNLFTYSPELDKYNGQILFPKKLAAANAILSKPETVELLDNIINEQVKECSAQGLSVESIAQNLKLTEEEVLTRLHDMNLLEIA